MAIRTDGTLWAWGSNSNGRLGLGLEDDTAPRLTPTQVGTATNWATITAGGDAGDDAFSLAIRTDGTLWAWGHNGNGRLGLGDTTPRFTPTQVGTDTNWTSVTAGFAFTVALRD